MFILSRPLTIIIVLCCNIILVIAQVRTCPSLMDEALSLVGDACGDLGRNQICYGHNLAIVYDAQDTVISYFSDTGDIIPIFDIQTLETSPLDIDHVQWGVAMMSLQANLPDTMPGQNVLFVVYGDAELTADFRDDGEAHSGLSFQLVTGIGEPACAEAPEDGVLVQSPEKTVVNFRVNGVDIEMGSTGLLSVTEEGLLRVRTLEGDLTVTSGGVSQQVLPGFEVEVAVDVIPNEPTPYDYVLVQNTPVQLLPQAISIPINFIPNIGWFDSGIGVEIGDVFSIVAEGLVNPCTNCDNHPFVGPEGLVERGTANDLDLILPLPNATVGSLIGRIGDEGEPFYIGIGGAFTASNSGTLQFRINDEPIGNESGTWQIVVERGE